MKQLALPALLSVLAFGCSSSPGDGSPASSDQASISANGASNGGAPSGASSKRPVDALSGVYAFAVGHTYDAKDTFVTTIMDNPDVDGIFIGFPWSKIAKSATTTDFSSIDAWLDAAAAAGKKVSIGIEAGSATPTWVGAPSDYLALTVYNFQQQTCNADLEVPIPWRTPFLAALKGLINSFATHLQANATRYATVSAIKITGINDNTYETSLPDEAAATHDTCTTSDDAAAWHGVGYTDALVESTWQTIIGYWGSAFTDKALCMQYIDTGFPAEYVDGKKGKKDNAVSTAMLDAAQTTLGTSRFVVEGTGLSAKGGPVANLDGYHTAGGVVGYQTLYYVDGDASCVMNAHVPPCTESVLHDAINLGIQHGMKYIEIYEKDIAGYPAEVTYAHQQLVK